ncbi:hypothetical protein [Rhizohabitans arisaemae]|uniref:hypothetical protein n=1 Tax=Rhizohabitans arisaemae TaxID=2720610 RepID=UPI0024B0881F|nr:hypothetical protein [Rhizohabitans arisaemae]
MLAKVIKIDMLLCAAFGVLLIAAAGLVGDLMNLPVPLVRWAGVVLLPVAAFLGYLASRRVPPRGGVLAIIAINALWAVDSIVLLFTGWIDPNPFGVVFIVAQALLVAGIAEMQYLGLRRLAPAAA